MAEEKAGRKVPSSYLGRIGSIKNTSLGASRKIKKKTNNTPPAETGVMEYVKKAESRNGTNQAKQKQNEARACTSHKEKKPVRKRDCEHTG